MEPTLFEATVEATADDARIRCIGDLNGRADAAHGRGLRGGRRRSVPTRITLDFAGLRVHQQHRDRPDRAAAHRRPGPTAGRSAPSA